MVAPDVVGEHTGDILEELGSGAQLADLGERGVVT
jgi:hypothetical protein